MFELIAQEPPIPNVDWTDVLWNKAPLVAFFGVAMWMLVWYGPQIVKALLDFLVHTKDTQGRLTASIEKLSENSCDQTEITHRQATEIQEIRKLQERVVVMADSFRCKHP